MFAEVDSSFALFVPLETHDFSVRTLCAYVNQEAEFAWRQTGCSRRFGWDLSERPGPVLSVPAERYKQRLEHHYPERSASDDRPLAEAPAFRNLTLQLAPVQQLAA